MLRDFEKFNSRKTLLQNKNKILLQVNLLGQALK